MKNTFLFVIFILPFLGFCQNPSRNFYKTKIYKNASTGIITTNDTVSLITYFDGLGRQIQNIAVKGGGTGQDIVQPVVYDMSGRISKTYLPFVRTTGLSSPNFLDQTTAIQNAISYYQSKFPDDLNATNVNPYSEIKFDDTPLNRVVETSAPGSAWSLTNGSHTTKVSYGVNTLSTTKFGVGDNVYDFRIIFANLDTENPQLSVAGYYPRGSLIKISVKDENWTPTDNSDHTTEYFFNSKGIILLKRKFDINIAHDTYYVYDRFDNLTYIIPPKAALNIVSVDPILGGGTSYGVNSAISDGDGVYKYTYDSRNRVIRKKVPNAGVVEIVYDKLDHPILTQDFNQFNSPENGTGLKTWLFTKFDQFDRIVYNGEFKTSLTRVELQNEVNTGNYQNFETRVATAFINNGISVHYTNAAYPNQNITVNAINFYDSYLNFDKAGMRAPSTVNTYGTPITALTNGLLTGSKVKVMDGNASSNSWITAILAYDDKARVVWAKNYNAYFSTTNTLDVKLNFTGSVLENKLVHSRTGFPSLTLMDYYTYDNYEREIKHYHKINDKAFQLISFNRYDDLGRLIAQKVGGVYNNTADYNSTASWQTIDYSYNIRGWLRSINNTSDNLNTSAEQDLFSLKLNYNTVDNTQSTAMYDGTISECTWKTKSDNKIRAYSYKYDSLYRLKEANYVGNYALAANPASFENYTESNIKYDKNGNILSLKRYGFKTQTNDIGLIDDLTYSYVTNSNRLNKVIDATGINDGFKDGANLSSEYGYDFNGNVNRDDNKGIVSVTYNYLNLPTKIKFSDTKYIDYVYDALGTKIKEVKTNNATVITTDYNDGFLYEQVGTAAKTFEYFQVQTGYIYKNGTDFVYVNQYKDQTGNVRLSYTKDSSGALQIIKEDNYYAFGLKHLGYNSLVLPLGNANAKKLGFNGQEFENQLIELNVNEMDFRQYDPALGRFNSVDLLSELYTEYTPYHFAMNNPVNFADPTGLFASAQAALDYMQANNISGEIFFNNAQGFWQIDAFNGVSYHEANGKIASIEAHLASGDQGQVGGAVGGVNGGTKGGEVGGTPGATGNSMSPGTGSSSATGTGTSGGSASGAGSGSGGGAGSGARGGASSGARGGSSSGSAGVGVGTSNGTANGNGSSNSAGSGKSNGSGHINMGNAIATLRARAYPAYDKDHCGHCARAVRISLEAGGLEKSIVRPKLAKNYGPFLVQHGFRSVSLTNYKPMRGDIVVIQNYPGGNVAGHTAMFDGKQWISDFYQRDIWAGPGYRRYQPNYAIYRQD